MRESERGRDLSSGSLLTRPKRPVLGQAKVRSFVQIPWVQGPDTGAVCSSPRCISRELNCTWSSLDMTGVPIGGQAAALPTRYNTSPGVRVHAMCCILDKSFPLAQVHDPPVRDARLFPPQGPAPTGCHTEHSLLHVCPILPTGFVLPGMGGSPLRLPGGSARLVLSGTPAGPSTLLALPALFIAVCFST